MKKLSIIFLFILVAFTSCRKFLEVNTTPNNATAVPPTVLLPTTTYALAFANSNDLNRATSALVQHIAGVANQTAAYDVYVLDGAFDNQWNFEIYSGAINNLRIIIRDHQANNPAYAGVAKLQLAYIFSIATDLWGDVPYSQAGFGLLFESPRFDSQEDIYMGDNSVGIQSLFDLVKEGLTDLDKPSILKPGADDRVYGGNLGNWKRMGNTLLLKFANTISAKNPAFAKTTIEAVLTGNNYINSNTLDFEVPYTNSVGNQNAIHSFNNVNRTGDQMLSSRLLALSRSLNDTIRLAKYFTKTRTNPANPFAFVAFNNGSTGVAPVLATRSKYNAYLTGNTEGGDSTTTTNGGGAPIRLLTNFQVQFILAESALILATPGTANTYYQAGIRANMQKIGMTTAQIDNYFLTNPNVVTLNGTTQQQLQQIITQKYIAWIGNGIEAYNDYRRTGYPQLALVLNPSGDNPNVIPQRLPYTPAELARNPNAPKPRPRTDVKVWWQP